MSSTKCSVQTLAYSYADVVNSDKFLYAGLLFSQTIGHVHCTGWTYTHGRRVYRHFVRKWQGVGTRL